MAAPVDLAQAVELAPRVWWVSTLLPDDQFQCHVYLVEQGDQSVLIDPGSALTASEVIRKVDAVVGLDHVRWLVCSHQDPDIIGALPALVTHGLHPDAAIVTHWRDEALIVHSGTSLPYWRIEEHDWTLTLEDRRLRFVFTPYAHFAGAFCTFDEGSGTLFSSDLFGGSGDDGTIFATSVDHFDAIQSFHQHYMPSRDIVAHALDELRRLPIERIAPQHGLVIPRHLVAPIMDRLGALECGIYLLARDDSGLRFLLTANRIVHEIVDLLVGEPDFSVTAAHIAKLAQAHLGALNLELWARASATTIRFAEGDGFEGHEADPPDDVLGALSGAPPGPGRRMVVPLRAPVSQHVGGAAVLEFVETPPLDRATKALLDQIAGLVEVGLEREVLRRVADLDRAAAYELATHDPLTGLYNRQYLSDAVQRLCAIDDRDERGSLAVLMVDVDHFKEVNDTYGHPVGDTVLQHVAGAITRSLRPGDVAVRFGGEEFLVLLSGVDAAGAVMVADRVRAAVAEPSCGEQGVTASVGVALRQTDEHPDDLVGRADAAMYRAKAGGRDRVEVA